MSSSERETQNRVVQLFRQELGYRYVGDWRDREGNSNIEEQLLTRHLKGTGYTDQQISRAIEKLKRDANDHSRKLYHNNKAVYGHLRYGVGVKTGAGKSGRAP